MYLNRKEVWKLRPKVATEQEPTFLRVNSSMTGGSPTAAELDPLQGKTWMAQTVRVCLERLAAALRPERSKDLLSHPW